MSARRRSSSPAEMAELAQAIRWLLEDPDARLSRDARLRWQGALVALETALGQPSSLGSGAELPNLL